MILKFISTDDPEYIGERELRARVLREPLGLPRGAEVFPFEDEALHMVAIEGGEVIGCVMFRPEERTGRMLQMAIRADRRKSGIGTALVKHLERRLKEDGCNDIYCHAREGAVAFYERLGYRVEGPPFVEVGTTHRLMRKIL